MLSKQSKDAASESQVKIINGNYFANLVDKHNITFKQIITRLERKRFKV